MRATADLSLVRAEVATIAAALERAYPETNRGWTASAGSLREDLTGETAMAAVVLLGAVAFVLLIACANVANLLVVRAVERRRDSAIRLALGARRSRVARDVLLESLVLSAAGGAIGLLAALWTSSLLVAAFRVETPYFIEFGLDWRVFLFGGVVTTASALACGIVPAWQASRRDVMATLKETGGSVAGAGRRFRSALAAAQLALALVLLAAAGLLVKTFVRTFAVAPGYDASRVLVGDLHLQSVRYDDPIARRAFISAVLDRVNGLPGVSAAVVSTVFFRGFGAEPREMAVEGHRSLPAGASPSFYYGITPEYLPIVGIGVVRGRSFARDESSVVVVNEEMARRVWPGGSPLGQRIRFEDAAPWLTVIGVGREADRRSRERPSAWVPLDAQPGRDLALYARTPGPGDDMAADLRAAVAAVDPDLPVEDLTTVEQRQATWAAPARFVVILMLSLAAVALLLSALGTYGVIAYATTQRTREIAVRLALGATPSQVQRLMARSGVALIAAGAPLGLTGAWASTRMLQGILAGTSPTDPAVFAAMTGILAGTGLLASWLPARRAARVDPASILRSE
jgi:putative ABC transport system permease protein